MGLIVATAQFYLTNVGKAAALDAEANSIDIQITHLAVGTAKYDGQAAAPAKTSLTTEIARYGVAGGGVNGQVLRLLAIFTPDITANVFEVGLFLADGTLFAIAAVTGVDPLLLLANGLTNVVTHGVSLADIGSNITVSVDANSPLAVSLISQHIAHGDPHPQYLMSSELPASLDGKYDKTGGELNGNILLKGYLELTGGRTVAKLYAADFLRLELNHPLLINDAVNVSNVVAATDLTVSDNGSTSITHSNIGIEGNFVRFSSSRDKYVFDKPIHAPNLNMLGVDQSWYDMTSQRAFSEIYTNNTSKPIQVSCAVHGYELEGPGEYVAAKVDSVLVQKDYGHSTGSSYYGTYNFYFIVPAGSTYQIFGNVRDILYWSELR